MNAERQRWNGHTAEDFRKRYLRKQEKGQMEHGGELPRKPCLEQLGDEIVDQWAYYSVLVEHVKEVRRIAWANMQDESLEGTASWGYEKIYNILTYGNPEGEQQGDK